MAAVLFIKKKSLTEWTFLCFPSRVMCLMWAVNASKQGSCGKCFREQDMTDEAGVAEIEGDYTIWHCPADSDSPSILKWKWAGEWTASQQHCVLQHALWAVFTVKISVSHVLQNHFHIAILLGLLFMVWCLYCVWLLYFSPTNVYTICALVMFGVAIKGISWQSKVSSYNQAR